MAEPTLDRAGLEFLATQGAPVPGESLTNSPDQAYAWEQAPQFTSVQPALDATFLELTEPDAYHELVKLMRQGVPIGQLTDIIIYKGFTSGLWNPDLAMLLLEPMMYLLIALATHAGIDEPVLDDEPDTMEADEQLTEVQKAIEMAKEKIVPELKLKGIPREIQQRVDTLEIPERPTEPSSLLSREEQA
jgi:hypothetical protein